MTTLKAQPHEAQFRLKSLDRKLNAQGTDSYSVEVYPRYGSSWSKYPKEMFVRGNEKLSSAAIFEELSGYKPGDEIGLLIVPGKVKAGKADDGDDNSYFWNIAGLAQGKSSVPPPPPGTGPAAPAPADARPTVNEDYWTERNRTIEAEWAINQARELMQWEEVNLRDNGRFLDLETLVSNAQWFLDAKLVLTNAMRSGVRLGIQNQPSEASDPTGSQPEPAEALPEQPSASPASVAELLTRATKELGYHNRAEIFAVLSVQSANELASLEKLAPAWRKLEANKRAG